MISVRIYKNEFPNLNIRKKFPSQSLSRQKVFTPENFPPTETETEQALSYMVQVLLTLLNKTKKVNRKVGQTFSRLTFRTVANYRHWAPPRPWGREAEPGDTTC